MDDMHQKNVAAEAASGPDGYTEKTLGGKLHKAFMAEVGEEMCEAEVAHHANRCPQYFCSRPEKHVHLYKKALGINAPKMYKKKKDAAQPQSHMGEWEQDGEEDWVDPFKRVTKPSDLELYERRLFYPSRTLVRYRHTSRSKLRQWNKLHAPVFLNSSDWFVFMGEEAHTFRGMSQTRCQ